MHVSHGLPGFPRLWASQHVEETHVTYHCTNIPRFYYASCPFASSFHKQVIYRIIRSTNNEAHNIKPTYNMKLIKYKNNPNKMFRYYDYDFHYYVFIWKIYPFT
ncbi:hypothetical protein RND81_10G250400 [Saponaria officinalis]|uniref:Uncharacterized protein n=1 Tax=Saponaria officinalis TaxID=3572 RepID=A0AAW1I838_SAPOF